jgi:hypothetical protein
MHSGAIRIPRFIVQPAGIFLNHTLCIVFSAQQKSRMSQAISSIAQSESKAAIEFDEFIEAMKATASHCAIATASTMLHFSSKFC